MRVIFLLIWRVFRVNMSAKFHIRKKSQSRLQGKIKRQPYWISSAPLSNLSGDFIGRALAPFCLACLYDENIRQISEKFNTRIDRNDKEKLFMSEWWLFWPWSIPFSTQLASLWVNIASHRFLHNRGNVETQGRLKSGLCSTLYQMTSRILYSTRYHRR